MRFRSRGSPIPKEVVDVSVARASWSRRGHDRWLAPGDAGPGAGPLGGARVGEGEEEPAAQRQEGGRAGREGGQDELRVLPRGEGQGRRRRRGRAQSKTGRLDVEPRAGRDGRRALLED